MKLYLHVIKFSFLRFFTYPVEILAGVLKRITGSIFTVLLWIAIKEGGDNPSININELIGYYFVVTGVSEIVMGRYGEFGSKLTKLLKSGEISNILIKPVNTQLYVYFSSIGSNGVRIIISVALIFIGIIILQSFSIFSLLSFIVFFVLAIINSYAFNLLEGVTQIYMTGARGLHGMINHIKSILGGLMIPIYLFPDELKKIVEVLPFSTIFYLPAYALKFTYINDEFVKYLLVGIFWAILLTLLLNYFWRRALKHYESQGI